MAVDYRLTLAGHIPAAEVAECAVPDVAERPRSTDSPDRLSIGLYEERGFWLSVRAGRDGYYEAEEDSGTSWEWEPDEYVNVTFSMDKNPDILVDKGTPNMLRIVGRVLECRSEDAALILNGNWLLLTRFNGVLRKHNRVRWWNHYDFANEILPG